MNVVKVGSDRYVNIDRVTYVEPGRKNRLVVHFDVGGGNIEGPSCRMELEGAEADAFRRWLDVRSEDAGK